IEICRTEVVSGPMVLRWTVCAVLFIMAKEQNTPLAVLLAIFTLRIRRWSAGHTRELATAGVGAILIASMLNVVTSPRAEHKAAAYNVLFLALTPESDKPAADLQAFGLRPGLVKYSGTGTWSSNGGFYDPEVQQA